MRAGLSRADYIAAANAVHANVLNAPAKIQEVAALAKAHGAIMLAHDERTTTDREASRLLGMVASELSLT